MLKRYKVWLDEAQWMYHGSPHGDIKQLKPDRSEFMIDRAIGAHFAADPEVSKKFAGGLYRHRDDGSGKKPPEGALYRTRAPHRSELHTIHQKNYRDKATKKIFGKQSDQNAIGAHVSSTVFSRPEHKHLFKSWLMHSRRVDDDTAEKVHQHLSQGKAPAGKEFGNAAHKGNSFQSYMNNYDSGLMSQPHDKFREHVVGHYHDIMKKRGIKGLVYHNTSPEETKGGTVRSKKSYVLFHPHEHPHPLEKV